MGFAHRGRRAVTSVTGWIATWGWLACGSGAPSPGTCWTQVQSGDLPTPRTIVWNTVADLALAAQTASDPVSVPATDVAYRLSTSGCVQIDSLSDPLGRAWVTPPATLSDYDLFCKSCPQRAALGVRSGLYVLPSSDPLPMSTTQLQLRAALRDCGTLLPSLQAGQVRVEYSARQRPTDAQPGILYAELAITPGSIFFDSPMAVPGVVEEAVTLVNSWLAPGQLVVRILRARRLSTADTLRIERGDHIALVPLGGGLHACDPGGRSPDETWVPIVLAGCLSVSNTVLKRSSEPEGLTPGIPSGLPGADAAHGVYIKGRGCDASAPQISWTAESLARVLGHELGHYLGVYHAVELDGSADALDDTDADNLMYARPSAIAQPRFTASQFRVMRQHPAIAWQ
ncbi:MAG: hypothetical protein E6Q99_05780 [Elusimicrobia bacterium]|nr:MAG: hypothetical protein E6Q99_05780 [Elusimicrobiota bacterium]